MVAARTEYITLPLTFKAAKGMAPPYLQDLIYPLTQFQTIPSPGPQTVELSPYRT